MTQQLSALRVSADLDAAKYAAGMAQKVAADKAGTASSAALGQAVTTTEAKISASGDVLQRLSRQYVDGYATAQRMNSAVNQLSRGIETGRISMAQAGPILDGIVRRYQMAADASAVLARGQTTLATAITAANAKLASQQQRSPANSNRLSGGQLQGLGYQANDVITMALLGAPLSQIAASQGGQIFQTLQMGEGGISGSLKAIKGSAAAAGTALLGTLGTVGLISSGFGLAAIAAGGFYLATREKAKDLKTATDAQRQAVMDLAKAYGDASLKADDFYKKSIIASESDARRKTEDLQKSAAAANAAIQGQLVTPFTIGRGRETYYGARPEFSQFGAAISILNSQIKAGRPDYDAFEKSIAGIVSQNPGLQTTGDKILAIVAPAAAAAAQLRNTAEAIKDINRSSVGNFDRTQQAGRDQSVMSQRFGDDPFAAQREQQRQKVIALTEAQDQRKRSLDQTVASQKLDIDLIGKSTAATEAARMQFDLTAQLKEEAARNGVAIDQTELANIKAKSAAYGQLKAQQDAVNALRDQVDDIAKLRLEGQLVGQNDNVRTKALATYDAEIKIQQLGIDTYGKLADQMRANAAISADLTSEIQKQNDVWGEISGTATSAIDAFVDSASNGFKDIASTLEGVAKDILKTSLQLTVGNPLKNWLTGSDLATMGDAGQMGGFIGKLLGRSGANPASAVTSALADRTTAMMTVTAGVVNLNGGGVGGLGGILGGAAPTGDISSYAAAIRSMESSGNYQALGSKLPNGDQALGAYQVMASNLPSWSKQAFGQSVSRSDFLGSEAIQDTIFQQQFGKSLGRYGNPQDAASVWFTGRPMATGSGASDILGTTGSTYVAKFNDQLKSMATTTGDATKSVGTFGSGLGNLGNALSQFPAAPSGGGGGFLSGLFGGGGGGALSPQALAALNSGPGLFDLGGYTGPGGRHQVAGVVHRGEVVFSQDDVYRAGGVHVVEAMRRGLSGYANGGAVAMPSMSRMQSAANANSGPQVDITINNAPAGTRVRESKGRDSRGNEIRSMVIDIMKDAETEGEFDSIRETRTGVRPRPTVRGQ